MTDQLQGPKPGAQEALSAASPQNASRKAPRALALPTLLTCGAASLVLLVTVGLQAPAVSVGLRWKPSPRGPLFPPLEPFEGLNLEFPSSARGGFGWLSWLGWILGGLLALVILRWVVRWIYHLIRPTPSITAAATGADSGAPAERDVEVVQAGLAAALRRLTSERDPGNGVVRAWQGLEDAAAAAGVDRHPAETTSEFTARLLYRSRDSVEPIEVLQSLYQRVRFGEHSPDAAEIASARESLATLIELWRTDLPERRTRTAAR